MAEYKRQLRYALYIIFHPFEGFWDMKHEKRGGMGAAFTILALALFSFVARAQYLGFSFNPKTSSDINLLLELLKIAVPFLIYCIANYCLTTLMDGEGTFGNIFMASCYAMTPIVLIQYPIVILSNVLTLSENTIVTFFTSLMIIWMIGLLFSGMMVVHQYSLGKTVGVALLTIVGMGIVIFIGLLFFSLIDKVYGFFSELYSEIILRMG